MFDVYVETRISGKTGKEYTVMVIKFPCGYQKLVFLTDAEVLLANIK